MELQRANMAHSIQSSKEILHSFKNDMEKIFNKIECHVYASSHMIFWKELRKIFKCIKKGFKKLKVISYSTVYEENSTDLKNDDMTKEMLAAQVNCINMHRKLSESDIERDINLFIECVVSASEMFKSPNASITSCMTTSISEQHELTLASYANDLITIIFTFQGRFVDVLEKNHLTLVANDFEEASDMTIDLEAPISGFMCRIRSNG